MKKVIRYILEAIEPFLIVWAVVLEWGTIWAYIMCGYIVIALVYGLHTVIKGNKKVKEINRG